MKIQQLLHDGWTLRPLGGAAPDAILKRTIPATVPGCVHTDLLASQLIGEPYYGRREHDLQWVGETDWQYSCDFTVDADLLRQECIELVCEGLDTVARLQVNDQVVGETANMHRTYRFDVKPYLITGENQIKITFFSPLPYIESMREKLGDRPCAPYEYNHRFAFIRRMACGFGWDWGPTLITAGMWRPIYLEGWRTARLAHVRPQVTRLDKDMAELTVLVDFDRAPRHEKSHLEVFLRLIGPDQRTLKTTGSVKTGSRQYEAKLQITAPHLWWPRGYGDQPLYRLDVQLWSTANRSRQLDSQQVNVGLRTVKLNTEADNHGSKFQLEVNNQPIYCKGANWIPDDCFPSRVTERDYQQRLEQACEANMNIIRVWGGGVFESETFYDLCDRMGLLVWQDFLFACATYSEEEPLRSEVEAEARDNVARLCKHPSLAIWNGCNENFWGYFDWGWAKKLENKSWGLGYYMKLLPDVVKELDPTRPYWPGSPYSGSFEVHPCDDDHGNRHFWKVFLERQPLEVYRTCRSRFVSEFGFQGPATYSTLAEYLPAGGLAPDSPELRSHQKSNQGQEVLASYLENELGLADPPNLAFDDWHYFTSILQVRALTTSIEWFRSLQPRNMGAIFWQLNDCWPAISWSAIDSMGKPKPLWYAARRFFAPRLLTIQPVGAGDNARLVVFASNDTDQSWRTNVAALRVTLAGKRLADQVASFDVPARTTQPVMVLSPQVLAVDRPQDQAVFAQCGNLRAWWFFAGDGKLNYPEPRFDAELREDGGETLLTISARTFMRELCLFADRLDPAARVSDQCVTLLPGEEFTFRIRSRQELTKQQLTSPSVLRCVNELTRLRTTAAAGA